MKNHAEIYEALLQGKTLCLKALKDKQVRLINGNLCDIAGRQSNIWFRNPEVWEIYEPPKWYENIPEQGVLCRVQDATRGYIRLIIGYSPGTHPSKADDGGYWKAVEPLSIAEVEVLLEAAKAVENLKEF